MRWFIVLLFLVAAPAASAEPVALLDAPHAADVAVAGTDVVVTRDLSSGGVRVDAVAIKGGAVRPLLALAAPRPRWHGKAFVAASAQLVAVLVAFDDSGDVPRERRVYAGPPSGPLRLVAARRARRRDAWVPVNVDVDGDRVLLTELRIRRFGLRARVLEPGLAAAIVPGSRSLRGQVALAGDYVAFPAGDSGAPGSGVERVVVVDRRTGDVAASLALDPENEVARDLDLGPDGGLVAEVDGRLLTAGPGAARAVVPGSAGLDLSRPKFAGSSIGALELTRSPARRPVVFDAGERRVLGMPSTAFGRFTANEQGFAWIANGCVLYAPVDGAPPAEPPDGPCPRSELLIDETDQLLHGRRVRLEVTCIAAPASGCLGSLVLRNHGIAGRGRFGVPAGATAVVDVVLNRRGARRVRRALKRSGDAFLALDARPQDGRVPGGNRSQSIAIDRVARR